MTRSQKAWFWLICFITFGFGVYALRGVLPPFVAGMVLAYFLDPLADMLERRKWSRTLATATITISFVLLAVLAFLIVVPVLNVQISTFATRLP